MHMIRQAIVTKWLCPTNVRGSRVKAIAAAGSVTLSWNHSLNPEQNHARAAEALANKFKWRGHWFGGGMPKDSGYAFICVDSKDDMTLAGNALFSTAGQP